MVKNWDTDEMVKHDDDEMKIYTAPIDGVATHEAQFRN